MISSDEVFIQSVCIRIGMPYPGSWLPGPQLAEIAHHATRKYHEEYKMRQVHAYVKAHGSLEDQTGAKDGRRVDEQKHGTGCPGQEEKIMTGRQGSTQKDEPELKVDDESL
jgi:hypothetical protein